MTLWQIAIGTIGIAGTLAGLGMTVYLGVAAFLEMRKLGASTFSEPITDSELDGAHEWAELHLPGEG